MNKFGCKKLKKKRERERRKKRIEMRAVYNGICISSDFFLLWHPGLRRPCLLKRPMKVAKEGLRRYTCATNRNSPWT